MLVVPPRIEAMADFLLRDIDERVAERIKEMARQKGWPLNDVILHLIKQALGIIEPEPAPEPGDIARLTGSWNDDESRAFAEAMAALNSLPDDAPSYMADAKKKPGG
jgi:predicted NAD/FAD-dependent oxidoreductase